MNNGTRRNGRARRRVAEQANQVFDLVIIFALAGGEPSASKPPYRARLPWSSTQKVQLLEHAADTAVRAHPVPSPCALRRRRFDGDAEQTMRGFSIRQTSGAGFQKDRRVGKGALRAVPTIQDITF